MESIISPLVGAIIGFIIEFLRRKLNEYLRFRKPILKVLDGLVTNKDSLLVLSTISSEEYEDMKGEIIDFSYNPREKFVTMVHDAWGLTLIDNLLRRGGKKDTIDSKISTFFRDSDWEHDLLLMGSPLSNKETENALTNSPVQFSTDAKEIIDRTKNARWSGSADRDYGIVVKLSNRDKVIIVVAGLGPMGTAGAAHYLSTNFRKIAGKFSTHSFAVVLQIDRSKGYGQWEEILSRKIISSNSG